MFTAKSRISFVFRALILMIFFVPCVKATLLGPTPYLAFSDSPFFTTFSTGNFQYFFLEDFEDGVLNVPGVSVASVGPHSVRAPGPSTDSVDFDDGLIDGSGTAGYSFLSRLQGNLVNAVFSFNSAAPQFGGLLPTHVGMVWTDGNSTPLTFEAFDSAGVSLGTVIVSVGDNSFSGTTNEDRFFGVINNPGGISRIAFSNTTGGLELDHLQYGRILPQTPTPIPLPATMPLILLILLFLPLFINPRLLGGGFRTATPAGG